MINCFLFSISYWHRKFGQDKVEKKLETDIVYCDVHLIKLQYFDLKNK